MPRILGVDIPKEKKVVAALPYIYGVGRTNVKLILDQAKVDPNKRAKDLTDDEIARIATFVQSNYIVEGDLRREISENVRRLMDIGTYRGMRHRKGLPVHGQRTKTNSRTRKGRKATVGGKKMSAPAPAGKA